MVAVPVFNVEGKRVGEMEIDPAVLGGRVRPKLLKQAIVAYADHRRQRSARTKGRADKEGSTRKLYRQKGTGNARVGNLRTAIRRGGGRAFAKRIPTAEKAFPKKMRRLARNNAILAKIESENVLIVEGLSFSEPKTKALTATLSALGIHGGCLLAMHEPDRHLYLSSRNIPDTDVCVVADLNAYDVLLREKLLFTKPAFERLQGDPTRLQEVATGE
ncbi:MAG: 50S ribosomal protein L4 [Planctomycetes bacterium]|nr:50S ribosomal protein L4 [Planctomycetota bacterium]